MPSILAFVVGMLATGAGLALAVYSMIKTHRICTYAITHGLAPELTKHYYTARFHFAGVCAAYVRATGDRASVKAAYVSGVLAMIVFVGGGLTVIHQLS